MPKEPAQNIGRLQPCPNCDAPRTIVEDTRHCREPFEHTRRRRKCGACGYKFTTREIIADADDLLGFMAGGE